MTDRRSDAGDRRVARDERDLTALVEELSATLDALRDAVGEPDSPEGRRIAGRDRGVAPGPAPPTPRELLRFSEQYTIPTLIALLESGIRSLELLRATLRLLDGRGIEEASPAARERVESVGRTTFDRVDAVLSDLSSAVEGGEPGDPDARDLLADARALREEIDDRLRAMETGDGTGRDVTARRSGDPTSGGRDIPVRPADRAGDDGNEGGVDGGDVDEAEVGVDVDAELESIRRDLARERGDASGDDASSGPGEDDGSASSDGEDGRNGEDGATDPPDRE